MLAANATLSPVGRAAGILLHPTSLPGPHGIGDLGPAASAFLAWAESAGLRVWQVLPLGPTGYGNSPYGALSAFAGNPLLVSPELLAEEGLLPRPALAPRPHFRHDRVDYDAARSWKEHLLRASFAHFLSHPPARLRAEEEAWLEAPEQAYWLGDFALFVALKARHGGAAWTDWPPAVRRREPAALAEARRELRDEIAYHSYGQFLFFRQWDRLRSSARSRGISILGDVPIYVAADSAEIWAHPELFKLAADGRPRVVAGVPPDYFSATGQRWGNPIYDWRRMARDGYRWWIERLRANLRLADRVRLDHFRGFVAHWEIPAREPTAIKGRWVRGPGDRLFAHLLEALGPELPLVAEDLGVITEDVVALRERFGLPGMRVLQFAFAAAPGEDSEHAPHNHTPRSVVYTGTHDNDTSAGWHAALDPVERQRVDDYLGRGEPISVRMVRAAYTSVAELAIVPLQDFLGLGSEARMNTPATPAANWAFRARAEHFTPELAAALRRMAEITGRRAAAAVDEAAAAPAAPRPAGGGR
jgi:4-alpha-glucanotransferase